jgi:hypothetical protein
MPKLYPVVKGELQGRSCYRLAYTTVLAAAGQSAAVASLHAAASDMHLPS